MKWKISKSAFLAYIFVFNSLLLFARPGITQDEYSFDMSAYEKSPFEFGGYAELRLEHARLNTDAAIYQLNIFDGKQPETNNRYATTLQLEGRYQQDEFTAYARLNPTAFKDDFIDHSEIEVHEAYLSWQAKTSLALDVGKKLIKWGKGYAWNPVGFVERPKDPNEPDLAREGFTVVSGDWIKSLTGDLQTISVTPVFLPVTENVNKDFGSEDNNFAGRVYMLYKDTDIDFLFLSQGSRAARYGLDFSRNISTNFEVHGEWAYINDVDRLLLDDQGNPGTQAEDVISWLLGLRYLTENDTTYIAEYYHNGAGFTEDQMRVFYQLVEDAPFQPDVDAAFNAVRNLANAGFVSQNVMRDYLYVRIMQKEPFDLLYVIPAITAIINLVDHSYNIAPEVSYTGINNLELRFKFNFLQGDEFSEFGEKLNDSKFELRARYFF